jgi:hypothetical protein
MRWKVRGSTRDRFVDAERKTGKTIDMNTSLFVEHND